MSYIQNVPFSPTPEMTYYPTLDWNLLKVEFANLLVLNKVDLVTPPQADQLEALLKKLNPKAKVGLPQGMQLVSPPTGDYPLAVLRGLVRTFFELSFRVPFLAADPLR